MVGGEAILERIVVTSNFQDGVQASSKAKLSIINSMLGANGLGGGAVSSLALDGVTADISYSTFAHRAGQTGPAIACRNSGSVNARNSIIVGTGTGTLTGCATPELSNCLTDFPDTKDKNDNHVVEMLPPPGDWFKSVSGSNLDYHLKSASDAALTAFKEVALQTAMDPSGDFDGDPRPDADKKGWPGADIPK